MRTFLICLLFLTCLLSYGQLRYPETPRHLFTDTIQQTAFTDDFKWMENAGDPQVRNWIKQQNDITTSYLQKNTRYLRSWERIEEIASYSYNLPRREGNYYFSYRYESENTPAVLCYREDLSDPLYPLVRPDDISTKDRIDLSNYAVSKDNQYLAYSYDRNGSDWQEIRIINIHSKQHSKETLVDVKFSDIDWAGNGFFYSRYPKKTDKYAAATGQEIWYHHVGLAQEYDQLIYHAGSDDANEIDVSVITNGNHLLIYDENKTTLTKKIQIIDLGKKPFESKTLLSGKAADIRIIGGYKDSLVAISSYGNNNGSIIKLSIQNPTKWVEFISELEDGVIVEATAFKDGIITVIANDITEYVFIYDWESNTKKILTFPPGYTVSGFNYGGNDRKMYFYFSSFVIPPVVYELDLKTFAYKPTDQKTIINYDHRDLYCDKLEYPSNDGTKIPMLIVYKKTLKKDNNNPVLLKSYGGYGIVMRPSFDPAIVHFLNEGGVFAYAFIRGEGIRGKSWGSNGRGAKKQQSFDDFIAAAEYLIAQGITKPSKLAITGRSNGGLVVAAAFTQRPDLFKAAVPEMGLYDMMHFENETIGAYNTDEYGTVKDPASFKRMLAYSPLHHITTGKTYPSLMIVTAENDERVAPFHSYKLAAKFQQLAPSQPVLLRTYAKSGHSGDVTWNGRNKSKAEKMAFILAQLKD